MTGEFGLRINKYVNESCINLVLRKETQLLNGSYSISIKYKPQPGSKQINLSLL